MMHRLDNPRVLAEDLQEGFAVPIFLEDVFSRVAARGHMVQRTVEIYSERTSRDLAQATQRAADSKIQDLTLRRLYRIFLHRDFRSLDFFQRNV